ncbi:fatty acid desaturase family protein [Nocardia sp. XZ_19_369]|uniref:fatty acid desaturase family protein n=1 Tax=Nocardia sp. XZ_19_369 TaxID=2769487 RepID=UPI0018907E1C|nr:fatty acid desaturase family protein [Nocardia sp. XZ_19_369]
MPQEDRVQQRCRASRPSSGGFKRELSPETKEAVKDIHNSRDNWHGPLGLLADWLVIIGSAVVVVHFDFQPLVYLAGVIIIAGRQRALRSLMHEASHLKLTRHGPANKWLGRVFIAWPIFSGLSAYTCAHCEHHRHLWDDRRDPKLLGYMRLGLVNPRDMKQFVRRHLLKPLLMTHVPYQVTADLIGRDEDRKETRLRFLFLGVVSAAFLVAGAGLEFLLLWVVPYVTFYQILRYWSDIADHAGLRSDNPWQATRSWDAPWLVRQFLAPHNSNWHLAHHLYQAVPHYRIRQLHETLQATPSYQDAHHCDGFLFARNRCQPAVVQDVLQPERLAELRARHPQLCEHRREMMAGRVQSCPVTALRPAESSEIV